MPTFEQLLQRHKDIVANRPNEEANKRYNDEMAEKRSKEGVEAWEKIQKRINEIDEKKNKIIPKSRMKTMKIDNSKAIARKNALNKLIEFEPKLREKTSKFIDNIIKGIEEKIPKKPKKRLMTTTKISKPIKKKPMSTMKIVEYKPKVHELDKVVELLGDLNQTKEIINAIKYVKNFIKKN
jgi:hypothetical protein